MNIDVSAGIVLDCAIEIEAKPLPEQICVKKAKCSLHANGISEQLVEQVDSHFPYKFAASDMGEFMFQSPDLRLVDPLIEAGAARNA